MANYPPPYPPPGPQQSGQQPPFVPVDSRAWKYQRRMLRDQAKAQREQIRYQMRGMRRGSILGPVLAVAIGIVFLLVQTGHLRNERVWMFYGQWWPLLLVLAGAVLLLEWGIDQLRPAGAQHPYARRSVGGGVITLIVLLALGGAILNGVHGPRDFLARNFSINSDNLAEFLGSKHESDQTLEQPLSPGTALTVNNPHGDITVNGTSSDGQMHLSLHKQVYSNSDTEAESKSRELAPEVTSNGGMLSVSVPPLTGATGDLVLTVPAGTALTLNANHGEVHVDGVRAPVTVTANHGDVSLSEIGGAVVAHANSGGSSFSAHRVQGSVSLEGRGQDITLSDIAGPVTLSGDFYGTTHLEHIANAIKFHTSRTDFGLNRLDGEVEISSEAISADHAAGPLVLTTRNRNITLDHVAGEVSVTNRNGTVDVTNAPPLGNVTVQNRHGSVTMTLPEHANFAVDAETTDGDVQNDFSLPSQENDSRKTLNGTVGKGGSLIRINTSQGDVILRKASITALAPRPPMAPTPPVTPQISIQGPDGGSVYVGKDGVRIFSGADGGSVIVGKNGLKITANADGSTVYKGKDGTELIEGADGSKTFTGRNGLRYTEGADGSKTYNGADGSTISILPDGTQSAKGAHGKDLSETDQRRLLAQAQEQLQKERRQRDEERKELQSGKSK